MPVYTSGDWHVKPGREEEFVTAWHDFAQQSTREIDATGQGTLLRDADDPAHFVSFGTWRDAETVERWRDSETFRTNFARIRELTESSVVKNYELAAQTELLTTAR